MLIDSSWQGINGLFVLAYLNDATSRANSYRKYFLPRIKIENYNIEIDGRNSMTSQLMTQLNNMTKLEKYQQDKVMIILLVVY